MSLNFAECAVDSESTRVSDKTYGRLQCKGEIIKKNVDVERCVANGAPEGLLGRMHVATNDGCGDGRGGLTDISFD